MEGGLTFRVTDDFCVDYCAKIFTPLLHWIDGKEGERPKPQPYEYGSRGPEALNSFITKYGYRRSEAA